MSRSYSRWFILIVSVLIPLATVLAFQTLAIANNDSIASMPVVGDVPNSPVVMSLETGVRMLETHQSSLTGQTAGLLNSVPVQTDGWSCDDPLQVVDLMLVIDRSGSMGDQDRLVNAKIAAKELINYMNLTVDQVGLASFGSTGVLNHTLSQDGDSVKAAIDNLSAFGSTAMDQGIIRAHEELTGSNHNPDAVTAIVLLSDGFANIPTAAETAASNAKNDDIYIITIGLSNAVDENLLKKVV